MAMSKTGSAKPSSDCAPTICPIVSDQQLRLLALEAAELLLLTRRLQQCLCDTGLGLGCEIVSVQTMAVRLVQGISGRIRDVTLPVERPTVEEFPGRRTTATAGPAASSQPLYAHAVLMPRGIRHAAVIRSEKHVRAS